MHNPAMLTPDGKYTTVVADFRTTQAERDACARVCAANSASDVLPMLGLDQ